MTDAVPDLDAVVAFIAEEQTRPERRCTYVGTRPEGIRAELDALAPPWPETLRVVTGEDGALRGAVVVEWDEAAGRSWVLGPWVGGDAAAWDALAPGLLDAALSQLPITVTRHEVCSDVSNELLAELAAEVGWRPTAVNHAYVVDEAAVAGWPDDPPTVPVRDATPADAAAMGPLHDAEFPGTYATVEQLLAGQEDSSWVVLVVPGADDELAGYAAGRVQPDGEGYIDYLVVHPGARRAGVGRRLVTALTRELLAAASTGRVHLTVQDERAEARALYEALGFRLDESFVAYRSDAA
jgi:ribosomal protein S18 acetylase RimI-like enzyme